MTTGRPRDARADHAILDAAARLLAAGGYAGLAMDAVARDAGVAKTTVYRRWPTKAHLVLAVVERFLDDAAMADTGDLRSDLAVVVRTIAGTLTQGHVATMAAELVAAAARDPQLRAGVQALWATRRAPVLGRITAAVDAGELPAATDPALVVDLLVGPLYYRVLITGDEVSDAYVDRLVEAVLDAALSPTGGAP